MPRQLFFLVSVSGTTCKAQVIKEPDFHTTVTMLPSFFSDESTPMTALPTVQLPLGSVLVTPSTVS